MAFLVEVKNISKSFDSFLAVDNVSFSLSKGEVLGFLGPNGAGKTTTMRILTGFLKPNSGIIKINGLNLFTNLKQSREFIGYVPEGSPLYNEMTTLDFLSFICEIRGINKDEKISRVVSLLNLNDVLLQKIDTLSKGFKRRVGLAQALIHDPKILILDEPTDGLDPNQKHEVRKLIKKLGKEKAIIISTHILEEVKAICNRTMILSNGKLLIDDAPNNVLKKSSSYNNLLISVHEKTANDLRKEIMTINKFKNVKVLGNVCSIKLKNSSDSNSISEYINKKKYTIKHFSINKGNLEEVFRELTYKND
ncbi:MAG: multidrug ABC transporter ATP-binding protein [Pelagibacterales bacterium]|nr:multidrug ABC transporter ATP-binding protein [Pelagibacterales bacterium]OUU62713.1 MAG: hypothetical protein CBC22_03530 [Alphaproteobacteria bacterium TMED62]